MQRQDPSTNTQTIRDWRLTELCKHALRSEPRLAVPGPQQMLVDWDSRCVGADIARIKRKIGAARNVDPLVL